jgi:hypothetical protein
MSNTILDKNIRDTSTYSGKADSGAINGAQLFHIVNSLNEEITVTFYGTRQEDADAFNDGEQIGTSTISASSSGYETLSDPWEEVQVEVVATNSPSSGSANIYEMN